MNIEQLKFRRTLIDVLRARPRSSKELYEIFKLKFPELSQVALKKRIYRFIGDLTELGLLYRRGKKLCWSTQTKDYVDILSHYEPNIRMIYTQYAFVNRGTIPATDVRIKLTYPAGTKVKQIIPPVKHKELEDDDSKAVELYINKMGVDIPISVLLITDLEPTEPPKILCNEDVMLEAEG